MIHVTNKNFNDLYPEIEETLKNASFISLDNEFSGLKTDNWSTESLFDTSEERYQQLSKNIQQYIIMQIGLTTFHHYREKNEFKTNTFTFYLLPRSIPTKHRHFLWQTHSIEFLSLYGFDFNKFAYDSICYVDEEEEAELKREVESGSFLRSIGRYIPVDIAGDVNKKINDVYEWLTTSKECETFVIEVKTPLIEYLVHKELRNRFPNIWTKCGNKKVLIIKVELVNRQAFEKEEGKNVLENILMNYYIGFSKIFKLLVSLKKPIVGHNIFLDLMFIHKQFYRPLPVRYSVFKENIHKQFPVVYDTKSISFRLGPTLKKEDKYKSNGLGELYKYFTEERGKCLVMFAPRIIEQDKKFLIIHDAGWDSYYAGYVFIKMAHIFAVKKFGSGSEFKKLTYTEIMSGVKPFVNEVNMIRANVSYLKLDGPDPSSTRPQWLYARLLGNNNQTVTEIAESLSSFGNVDVKAIAPRCALIAVGNHAMYKFIYDTIKKDLKSVCSS